MVLLCEIATHMETLHFGASVLATVIADLVAITVICTIYFGNNAKQFSMGYVPRDSIQITLFVATIEILVVSLLCFIGGFIAKTNAAIDINLCSDMCILINKNQKLFFWHTMKALVLPLAVLGHHWNFLWYLKNM